MKNTKLAITLIASALTLTQAMYAAPEAREWAEYFAQQHRQSAQEQVQPQIQPVSAQECTTINKQELADAIKAAVAEAVAKMAQKPTQAQEEPEEQPRIEARHKITRKGPETLLELQLQSDDYYDITIQEGDTLILDLKAYSEHGWKADMIRMNPAKLLYAKRESIAATQLSDRPWDFGPSTKLMYLKALKKGTQWLTFSYHYHVKPDAIQTLKINIVEKPKDIVPTPVTPTPAAITPIVQATERTVERGQKFVIEKEEDTASGETYSFDPSSSDTDFFQLVEEVYATENPGVKKSHYFVFKAIKTGTGNLGFTGRKNQPEQLWQTTHKITVEEPQTAASGTE